MTFQVEGYEVILAEDGKKALEQFKKNPVDLVVLDLMLPEIDGWQVCRKLREESDIPIIMLTAKDDEVDTILGLKLGADDYVTKPFSPRELLARVEAVLRRVNQTDGNSKYILTYPGITIDQMKRQVKVDGKEVELSPKEFDILWELAHRPGQVYSREKLLDRVWGYDYFGTTRTVDVHIKRLRAKLEEVQPRYNYIQTVWGVGYKFEVVPID
ncbi:DNA-binding response regulator [Anoxybacter fermentans]|uniref:Stage 0 sporulation protein A homolog n=2 Tax=Anoxybacter fermentans TaxID=1323375 RepID=A0A3S9T357_9FIRM|nr:DNA-binding response regulator [Anoxybacter fermentans]